VSVPQHVDVSLSVEKDLEGLHVDPDQVGQILVNLFTNAVQAIGAKPGRLTVRASDGNGRIKIEVQDSGPGVPTEMSEKIFEPLFTTKARGIGLGLAVSRSLAIANLGSLSVVNHPDGGAVFILDLPAGES
jgi:two-component system C4-dicarboxylate transport sensor histidine kinase DctB